MAEPQVIVKLSSAEALVLFEWVSRFNEADTGPFEDQAEQRVLWDIEAVLEKQLSEPLAGNYRELLASARAAVRDPDTPRREQGKNPG